MQGRLENKIKTERSIQEKLVNAPEYMKRFYHSIIIKSHTTKLRYINNVERFLFHVYNKYPSEKELKNIDSYKIQVYMSEILYYERDGEVHEINGNTQCNIYSALSSFFSFLFRSGYIDISPFDNKMIERPKAKENEVVYLTPAEVRKFEATIINGVGNQLSIAKQKDWKYRDLLLFRIPIINGLRVTALSEINIEDLDLDHNRIHVTEKGDITKWVDFDYKTAAYLAMWLVQREKLLGDSKCNALFISNRRTRITTKSIERLICKYAIECVPEKHITPHKLRNTCATNTYQVTGDIYKVSQVLGHKNTVPTKRYTHISKEEITNTINRVASLY